MVGGHLGLPGPVVSKSVEVEQWREPDLAPNLLLTMVATTVLDMKTQTMILKHNNGTPISVQARSIL